MGLSKRKLIRKHKVMYNYVVFMRLHKLLGQAEQDAEHAWFFDDPHQHILDAVNYEGRHKRFNHKFMRKAYYKHGNTMRCYLNN